MIDYRALAQFGTSNDNLRLTFSNWDGRTKEGRPHKKLRELIKSRVREGPEWCLRHAHHYTAAILLWDGRPILKEQVPLMLFAEGKLDVESCVNQLSELGCADKFAACLSTHNDPKTGREIKKFGLAKFTEVAIQIGRSYISRRLFAQTNKYNAQRPFLPYESRFRTQIGKLRGDLMSQYAQIASDNYGYQHLNGQMIRDMLLYGHSIVFPECAWDSETQMVIDGPKDEASGKWPVKTRIVREGVPFKNIPPWCTFFDRRHPAVSLNTDTGCEWVGFWDVKRLGDILVNRDFFNTERVKFSSHFRGLWRTHGAFFDLTFADTPVSVAVPGRQKGMGSLALAEQNERLTQSNFYTADDSDISIFLTDLRMKLIPRDWDLGDYPHPVWLRLLVANDDTIVFAEWLPSRPAFVASFNENDSRLINQGQAHEIMPFQDQISNIMSQLLLVMRYSLIRIICINKDLISTEARTAIEDTFKGINWYENPHLLFHSFSKMEDLGINPRAGAVVNIAESLTPQDYINNAFRAIVQLLSILERLLMLSPQEQGQPAPRETTATENALIEATTTAVYSSISDAVDEARGAMKRIIYESAMALASDEIYLPVSQTYEKATIEKAGLKVVEEESQENETSANRQRGWKITGTKDALVYEYAFTNRDSGNLPTNQQAANTLIALMGQVLPLIGPETLGKERIFALINDVLRLTGATIPKLEMAEGETAAVGDQQVQETLKQLIPALQKLGQSDAQHTQEIEAITEQLQKIGQLISHMGDLHTGNQPQPLPSNRLTQTGAIAPTANGNGSQTGTIGG